MLTDVSLPFRRRLPNRRDSRIETLDVGGQEFTACVGFDDEGRPKEIFLSGGKQGSSFDAILADVATVISIALQYGIPPAILTKSMGRVPASIPPSEIDSTNGTLSSSAVGAALDLITAFENETTE